MASIEAPDTSDYRQGVADADGGSALPRCYPKCCGKPWYQGNKQALGWATDIAGRAVAFIAGASFLATALLRLAREAANCPTDPLEGEVKVPDCDNRIYGIRPSSLLTTYSIVIGLITAVLMPLMGALVDYSHHRRLLGRIASAIFCFGMLCQVFLSSDTWFFVAIMQVVVAVVGWAHVTLTYAYLPELTDDEELLNKWTGNYTTLQFGSTVVFIIVVSAGSAALGIDDDDVGVARLGAAVAFVFTTVMLVISWSLFERHDALHQLPLGASIWSEGFKQVGRSMKMIWVELPTLRWFYIAVALGDSAIFSLSTVAVTFATDTLQMTQFETSLAILAMLLSSVPGGLFSIWFNARNSNPMLSVIFATVILCINTVIYAIVLKEPGQQIATYCLSCGWGFGTGWKWASGRFIASKIIPPGQDAELMGVYVLCGQILSWLPPLTFTILNEQGISQRVGVGHLAIYFALSVCSYLLVGDFGTAKRRSTVYYESKLKLSITEDMITASFRAGDERSSSGEATPPAAAAAAATTSTNNNDDAENPKKDNNVVTMMEKEGGEECTA